MFLFCSSPAERQQPWEDFLAEDRELFLPDQTKLPDGKRESWVTDTSHTAPDSDELQEFVWGKSETTP